MYSMYCSCLSGSFHGQILNPIVVLREPLELGTTAHTEPMRIRKGAITSKYLLLRVIAQRLAQRCDRQGVMQHPDTLISVRDMVI